MDATSKACTHPRVFLTIQLEEIISGTAAAFEKLSIDVQLLSSMYKGACDQMIEREAKVKDSERERKQVTTKLANSIKETSALRNELARKDQIVLRVMAAREESLKLYRESGGEVAAVRCSFRPELDHG